MMKRRIKYLAVAVLALGLAMLALALVTPASAGSQQVERGDSRRESAAIPKTLDRNLEPVVIAGSDVISLAGVPTGELFVYAYRDGTGYVQVPVQVDEVTGEGDYTPVEDGLLDANDEIAFMAADSGDRAPDETPPTDSLLIHGPWVLVEVTDPLNVANKGWAYLVRSRYLDHILTDYVDFDAVANRVTAPGRYSLGFGPPNTYFDYLTIDDAVNILDRIKIRADPIFGPTLTEEDLGTQPSGLISDGPVRVILRNGKGLTYGTMIDWSIVIPFNAAFFNWVRFSIDFSPEVSGSILYNAVQPAGVLVDGVNEAMPAQPVSSWLQFSSAHGTVIQVGDSSAIGGTQTNYYLDDSDVDPNDTGDQRSYGDTGVFVDEPDGSLNYFFDVYFLPGSQAPVGPTYLDYFHNPLTAAFQPYPGNRLPTLYLPIVTRSAAP